MNQVRIFLFTITIIFSQLHYISGQENRTNILLINIDDMGWKDVGFMGSRYYETPNIDLLASQGMVFTNGYAAASNCAPSRACLMSGQWTPRHGIYTVNSSERGNSRDRMLIPESNTTVLASEFITIAETLQSSGYSTCQAGKWHLGEDPATQGFDLSIGGGRNGNPESYYPPFGNVDLEAPDGEYLTDLIMTKTIQFIHSVDDQPFFLYYSPYAVHTPIHPVDSLMGKYENKQEWEGQGNAGYATMIDNLDRNIGDLVAELKAGDLFDNTLIIFTSDNGGVCSLTQQKPLRAGKGSYYDGGIREPFFAVWPGKIQAGVVSDLPVYNLDIYPTILEAAGIQGPEDYNLDGSSILPTLLGRNQKSLAKRPLFWHFPIYLAGGNSDSRDPKFRTRPGSVIRQGKWKLHQYFEDGGLELYNLKKNIGETVNMAGRKNRKARKMLQMLEIWREEVKAPVPSSLNPEYNPGDTDMKSY